MTISVKWQIECERSYCCGKQEKKYNLSLRTFTCSKSSRSNEQTKTSQHLLTNEVIAFELVGKQWSLKSFVVHINRMECCQQTAVEQTKFPAYLRSVVGLRHATRLDNSNDSKMLITSVLWRRGVMLLKNCTFFEWFFLISGETRVGCPVFFLLYRNVTTTHILY